MNFSAASLHAVLNAHAPAGATGFMVGLSGGADSACLLAALAALREELAPLTLRAVHIDHGLQAAAEQFREACTTLCEHLRVPLKIISVVVDAQQGRSLEAAARDARYAALAAQLKRHECLVTAHHRKDQAETMMLQALRGAGVKGMSAMPFCRAFGTGWHLRPVLDVPQSELLEFGAHLMELKTIDPMNADLRFDRSFLRRQVWPMLEQHWPGAETALSRAARHIADAQELLDVTAAADLVRLRDGEALSVQGLRALPQIRRMNAVRLWLREARVEPPSTARLVEALRQVFDAAADQMPAVVWGNAALRRYRHRLFLTDAESPRLCDAEPRLVACGSRIDLRPNLGYLNIRPQIGGIALEILHSALSVRGREGGETLKPARTAKTQSLQHLCQSQGVLPWMRDVLPLLFAGDKLIAVADLWLNARFCAPAGVPGFAVEWRDAPVIV
jgi:tRNA(Ile)-lysidine synthase